MASLFSTITEVALVNTSANPGTIQLPLTTEVPYRVITVKDLSGKFGRNALTLTTGGSDTFEDGSTSRRLTLDTQFVSFYATNTNKWLQIGGDNTLAMATSSLTISSINGSAYFALNPTNLVSTGLLTSSLQSTTTGLGSLGYISAAQLISTTQGLIENLELNSTVIGLGTVGYVSTPSLQSSVTGLGTLGFLSSIPRTLSVASLFASSITTSTISAFTILANTLIAQSTNISSMYLSSLTDVKAYISSLQIDEIQFGDGTGWADFGPLRATYISSLQVNTGAMYGDTIYVGNNSTLNQIRYWGIRGNYNNTILAEVSTGTAWGAQEFLVFRGSSASDRIRFQTTGDIRFEPQVSAREFSTATALATPTLILQSNLVGIATATPIATLDVRGTAFATVMSTQQGFASSLNGINVASLISSGAIQSTIMGLGTIGYVSSVSGINLNDLVSTPLLASSLQSTVRGLGSAGYLSSAQLISTVAGLGQAGYISSAQLISATQGLVEVPELVSTVAGLGLAGYISSAQLISTTQGLIDSPEMNSTIVGLGSLGYVSSAQLISATQGLVEVPELVSTVAGLGLAGYVSSAQLISTTQGLIDSPEMNSTIQGLGSLGYISSAQLISATQGLVEVPELVSTVAGLGQAGYISSAQLISTTQGLVEVPELVSTVAGLGQAGYISSAQLISTTQGLIDSPEMNSTIQGLGTLGYVSAAQLISTTQGLIDSPEMNSTIQGLGTLGYVSSAQLISATQGLVEVPELVSTVAGLGLAGYVSSTQLISTTQGLIDSPEMNSTIQGLGTIGFVSAAQLISTTQGLIDNPEMNSTILGLGTLGYVSAASLVSELRGLGSAGYISSASLTSSLLGIGTFGFLSTPSLVSTVSSFGRVFVTLSASISSITSSNVTASNAYISSLQVDGIQIGTGTGWVDIGPIQALAVSTLQTNTGSLYATSVYVGNTSTLNQIRYYGLTGNYNNTILAEVSTGTAWGAQEFLVFKGSSASDRIRFQTTGDIRFEPQVSAREFSTATALATPTLILQSNLVGIATATPVATLDVRGTAFATIASTQQLFTSSVNGMNAQTFISTGSLVSTLTGLGSAGYISSFAGVNLNNLVSTSLLESSLRSTTAGLGSLGYISAAQLISTTVGLIDSLEMNSTIKGLGTLDYISAAQLLSTSQGIADNFLLVVPLVDAIVTSTSIGLGTVNYISAAQLISTTQGLIDSPELNSSIRGLGTLGYVSSGQLTSTTQGLIDSPEMNSTIQGLGTLSYISAPQLTSTSQGLYDILVDFAFVVEDSFVSTTAGLGQAGYISSAQLISTTQGLIDNPEMNSTIKGLGTLGFLSGQTVSLSNLDALRISSGYTSLSSLLMMDPNGPFYGIQWVTLAADFSKVMAKRDNGTWATFQASNTYTSNVSLIDHTTTAQNELYVDNTVLYFNGTPVISGGSPVDVTQLLSTVEGLGTSGYLSSPDIRVNTVYSSNDITTASNVNADKAKISTVQFWNTTPRDSMMNPIFANDPYTLFLSGATLMYGPNDIFSMTGFPAASNLIVVASASNIISTVTGLGTAGYLSSAQTISLTDLVSIPYLDTALLSTTRGLGSAGYLSSVQTISLTDLVSIPYLDTALLSTTQGLGTAGYLSSAQTISLTDLVSIPYLDTTLRSTTSGLVDHLELRSTVLGLGTTGYISTATLASSVQSTVIGLGTINYISASTLSVSLQSTISGLGSARYLSSIPTTLSTARFLASSVTTSTLSAMTILANTVIANSTNISSMYLSSLVDTVGYISSLTVDQLTIGDGNGWADFGALRAIVVSSQQENTGSLYATTAYIGNTSTLNQVRYWGLVGGYNNTILAEVSTGTAWGAQEFLVFRGSSASDRIRFQTTGDIRFEPQVSAREFSTATALATPTMILQSNLVGIATATPITTLDVRGTAFATTISTQQVFTSSFNGIDAISLISTGSLISTVANLGQIYLSSASGGGGLSQSNLTSSIDGLGTLNYLSGPFTVTNTLIALDLLGGTVTTFSSLLGLGLEDALDSLPPWDSNAYIAGSDPDPAPLRVDVFGSARFLKNLYVGSTTTVLTTAGIQAQQVSSLQTTASTITLSDEGPMFLSANTQVQLTNLFLDQTYVNQRMPYYPIVLSTIFEDMTLQPEFLGLHFVLINGDSNSPHTFSRPADVADGWYCKLTQVLDSNMFMHQPLNIVTNYGTHDIRLLDGNMSNYGETKYVQSGGQWFAF